MAKTGTQLANNMIRINLPSHPATDKELDDEVRSMFRNRKEGLDYIKSNFTKGPDKLNAMKRLNRVYPEPLLTTREKWKKYLDYGMRGTNIDHWNKVYGQIESELPFESQAEHDAWLDKGSTWKGEPEWPEMTNKILDRIDKYSLEPSHIQELKTRYKGKDYDEAMKRLLGGEAFGDIINGLVTYER